MWIQYLQLASCCVLMCDYLVIVWLHKHHQNYLYIWPITILNINNCALYSCKKLFTTLLCLISIFTEVDKLIGSLNVTLPTD